MPDRTRDGRDRWTYFPPSSPLPAAGGLATSQQRGALAGPGWSQRFVEVLLRAVHEPERLMRGGVRRRQRHRLLRKFLGARERPSSTCRARVPALECLGEIRVRRPALHAVRPADHSLHQRVREARVGGRVFRVGRDDALVQRDCRFVVGP